MVKMHAPASLVTLATMLLSALPAAQAFEVQDGKLQSISSAGIAEHTATFPSDRAESKVLTLSSFSTLKLSYSITPASSASYSALILSTHDGRALATQLGEPTNSSESNKWRMGNSQINSVTLPITPKKGGRYRFEWDLSTPSSSTFKEGILTVARLGNGRLKAQLMVVPSSESSKDTTQVLELGTIALLDEDYYKDKKEKKYPREWEMERYSPREEIAWTFHEARKPVSAMKALIGLGAVLAPWVLLLGLLGQILPSLSLSTATASSAMPFLVALAALEGTIASYWIGLITVWTFMPCVAVVGLLALLSGKSALSYRMQERLSRDSDRAVGVEKKKAL